jgi:hypothetical protein
VAVVIELPISQQPMRVLTPDLSERLAAISDARVKLAELGARVTRQNVLQGTKKRPQLTIEGANLQLRMRICGLLVKPLKTQNHVSGRFGAVDLCWVEARPGAEL